MFTTAYGVIRLLDPPEVLGYQNFEEAIDKEVLSQWRGKRNALEFLIPRIGLWYTRALKQYQPDIVTVESSNFIPKNGSNVMQQIAEVRGVLHYITLIMRYPDGKKPVWQTISYLEVQRHFLGKVQRGREKGNMQEAIALKLDIEGLRRGKNNHACDALAAGITFAETKLKSD